MCAIFCFSVRAVDLAWIEKLGDAKSFVVDCVVLFIFLGDRALPLLTLVLGLRR